MDGLMQALIEKRKQHKEKKEKKSSKDRDKEKSLNPASPSIKDKETCGDYVLFCENDSFIYRHADPY
jgi:hypothetical protein